MRKKNHAKIRAGRVIREAVASMPGVRLHGLRLTSFAHVFIAPPGSHYGLEVKIDYTELDGARDKIKAVVDQWAGRASDSGVSL